MAECIRFVCDSCGFAIEAWSDGNPFYLDEEGKKVYAYHPNHDELVKCIANDVPHLCLDCGKEVKIDSRLEQKVCSKCKSARVAETYVLNGVECPKCREGRFNQDEGIVAIS
ncbi:MAG: hypothetical protein KDA36_13695 [Planctomycetaceae bacterium]|nr:hypothetical protein [Planctomycetaceae bacterium]